MNSPTKLIFLILILMMCATSQIFASPNCGICEEPNDPSLVLAGFPCTNKPAGTAVTNEPCKECDGHGNVRDKSDGDQDVNGVEGRCCGGVWYPKDPLKEASCWVWDTNSCTYVVVSVELDDSDLWFFRSEDYELPLTITPSSVSDLVSVSISGFDDVHWFADYNSPFKKIDFGNLILESEPVGWLDEQELSISAVVGSAADNWSWTKKLKFKKRLDGLWDDAKQDAINTINDYISPADDIKELVEDNLESVSAVDSEGLVHTISPGAISSAANFAYAGISTWWANFVGTYIWSDVPVSELHEKVTKESWTWDWNVDPEITFSSGSISLDPGFDDAVQWIESISDTGFSSETFVFKNAMIGTSVTANGETANADIEAVMNAFLRYANETIIDIETGETAGGRIEYGIGISLHIWF